MTLAAHRPQCIRTETSLVVIVAKRVSIEACEVPVPLDADLCHSGLRELFGPFCDLGVLFGRDAVLGAIRSTKGLEFRGILAAGFEGTVASSSAVCYSLCCAAVPTLSQATFKDRLIGSDGLADGITFEDLLLGRLARALHLLQRTLQHRPQAITPGFVRSVGALGSASPTNARDGFSCSADALDFFTSLCVRGDLWVLLGHSSIAAPVSSRSRPRQRDILLLPRFVPCSEDTSVCVTAASMVNLAIVAVNWLSGAPGFGID